MNELRTNRTERAGHEIKKRTRSGSTQTAYVRPGIVADALGVDARTVRRWCADGQIVGATRTAGDHWRIPRAEFERLKAGRARARAV